MSKPGLLIAAFVVAVLALMAYSTLHGPRYRLQVCMAFQGRSACKTVSSKTEDGAMRGAISNACADITSGVSEVTRCEGSEPTSSHWLSRPTQ